MLQTDRVSMKNATKALIGEQVDACPLPRIGLHAYQTHVGVADRANTYAAFTMAGSGR